MSKAQQATFALGGTWLGTFGLVATPGHGPCDRSTVLTDGCDGTVISRSLHGQPTDLSQELRAKGFAPAQRSKGRPD